MNCKNCGSSTEGQFCSNCGQNTDVNRINFNGFLQEVSESVFQVNKGFVYTLRELFIRPGASLKEFLNGKRKIHFKPIAYVLTLSTLYYLITKITNDNTWIDNLLTGWMNRETEQNADAKISEVAKWFLKNYAYSTLILLPVFSLASYLSFLKFGKNYLEHMVINAYITGQQAIFYILIAIGGTFIDSELVEALPYLGAIFYAFWVFWHFFSEGNRAINILRSLLTYLLYSIFCVAILSALMVIK